MAKTVKITKDSNRYQTQRVAITYSADHLEYPVCLVPDGWTPHARAGVCRSWVAVSAVLHPTPVGYTTYLGCGLARYWAHGL